MRAYVLSTTIVLVISAATATPAAAQIDDPSAGQCRVRATIPGTTVLIPTLLIEDVPVAAVPRLRSIKNGAIEYELSLKEPLTLGASVKVLAGVTSQERVVGPERAGARTSCAPWDTRADFEPFLMLGAVNDNFAPNDDELYSASETFETKFRFMFRASGQLRLRSVPGLRNVAGDRVWVEVEGMYGVRASEIDCSPTEDRDETQSPLCTIADNAFKQGQIPQQVTAVLLKASSMQAFFTPRIELGTFNRDSTPITTFVGARLGFAAQPGAPDFDGIRGYGGGVLWPTGAFRDSRVEFTLGHNRSYRTNPNKLRFRYDFRFVFNSLPKWSDQIPFAEGLSDTVRGLIQVTVDRTSGAGPDSAQTYFGIVFDFNRLLGQ